MAVYCKRWNKAPHALAFECRLQTAHVFEPFTDKFGKTQYSAFVRVYEPEVMAAIEKMKAEVVKEKFGEKVWEKKLRQINGNPNCCLLREPDDADDYKFMKLSRKPGDMAPQVFDRHNNQVTQADGLITSGAYVRVIAQFWAYDNQSCGVGATLVAMQHVKDGEPFSGTPKATKDDFEAVEGEDDEATGNDMFG